MKLPIYTGNYQCCSTMSVNCKSAGIQILDTAFNKLINGFHGMTHTPPKISCTWNWARDLTGLNIQLQSTLKGGFTLVFSINYSKCHHGQLAVVNWIWQVNLRALFTECTRDLGWAKGLSKTENRRLQEKKKIVASALGSLEIFIFKRNKWRENTSMQYHFIICIFY